MCKIFLCVVAAVCCIPQILLSQGHSKDIHPDDLYEIHQATEFNLPPPLIQRQIQPPQETHSAEGALKTNACASAFIMNTPYNSDNGQRGCMFDVLAANTITIRCFESNLYAGTTANYEIYYRAGTHVGFENNAGAWTFLGGATGVTSAGVDVPTALPITVNVTIPAGQTYSFYITNDFGAGTNYTIGTAVGNFLASDANLTVFEGVGKSYPFGLTFDVRNFNGHIFYDLGGVLDSETGLLKGEASERGAALEWEIPQVQDLNQVILERSPDGREFEPLANLNLEESGQYEDVGLLEMGAALYRLRMQGKNGNWVSSEAIELQMELPKGFLLEAQWPNPFEAGFNCKVKSTCEQKIEFELVDLMGKTIFSQVETLGTGSQTIALSPEGLAKGVYLLRLKGPNGMYTRRVSAQ